MKHEAEFTEHGAATIVSAIGSMRGVALGVSLKTKARISTGDGNGTSVSIAGGADIDSCLVEECIRHARSMNLLEGSVHVSVDSQIPPSRGMKSSSSVSLAVLGAAFLAAGRKFKDTALLRMSAQVSISAGVSLTGAYDDAAACHLGGLVFADNRRMRISRRVNVRAGYSALFCVPERKISKRSLPVGEIRAHSEEMKGIYREAASGRLREACRSNTRLLCRLLDIDDSPASDASSAGALISGLTGTGPAFFALCERSDADRVAAVLGRYGNVLSAQPTGVSDNGYAF